MPYPRMVRIRQYFESPLTIKNIRAAVRQSLQSLNLASKIDPGNTVAITAGSRGAANIAVVMKMVVEQLKGM
jgi:hypothetical protein